MTRAITDKAADVMPKPAGDLLRGAQNATERVIGGTYGSLEKLVRGLGRLLTGRATADTGKREEAMENFRQEALASWTAYQETGRHLTGQEVRDWLNSWGTDKENTIPECHE